MTRLPDAARPTIDPVAVTAVREIMNACDALRDACARHYGLTQTDILAMSHLAAAGPMTATDLAARLRLSGASVTSVADRLEKAGLAHRQAHETDRRRIVLAVSDHGRSRMVALQVVITRAMSGTTDLKRAVAVLTETAALLRAEVPAVARTLDAALGTG